MKTAVRLKASIIYLLLPLQLMKTAVRAESFNHLSTSSSSADEDRSAGWKLQSFIYFFLFSWWRLQCGLKASIIYLLFPLQLMKIAVRAESFNHLSTFIVIYLLQRCLQTIVRLVSLSVLHFNIFSDVSFSFLSSVTSFYLKIFHKN